MVVGVRWGVFGVEEQVVLCEIWRTGIQRAKTQRKARIEATMNI